MSYCLDWEIFFNCCCSGCLKGPSAYVTSIGFAFFEFARKSIGWEAVGDDLDQSAFVFRSFARGFQVFTDGLPAARFSYKEVGGFCGGDWYDGGVHCGREGVCILMIF